MIENFWEVAMVLIIVITALIGASWTLGRHEDELQKKYSDEIPEMEAIIHSSEILPEIIKIITNIEYDRNNDADLPLDQILAADKYVSFIKNITKSENKILKIKTSYTTLKNSISNLSTNIFWLAISMAIICLIYMIEMPGLYDINLISLLLIFPAILIWKIYSGWMYYITNKRYLSSMYDEVVMGISMDGVSEE